MPRYQNADLWTLPVDVRCVLTNGTVRNGRNVMGGGCARQAADRDAELPERYGLLLELHGNHVFVINDLVMFPTKHQVWDEKADVELIGQSAYELRTFADLYGWGDIALPQPGCGLGGLDYWNDIEPWLSRYLDDRFIVVDHPKVAA